MFRTVIQFIEKKNTFISYRNKLHNHLLVKDFEHDSDCPDLSSPILTISQICPVWAAGLF